MNTRDCNEEIDFEQEVAEFIENNFVNKIEFYNKKTEYIEMLITTLEGDDIYCICSSQNGIRIIPEKSKVKKLYQTAFDTFEGLLQTYSFEYGKKFNNDLQTKLEELAK
ncbi:GSKIP domain [Pseudocohnilembus persalinus]|uniref:GSKIP domain n=1 Tax=Pseudocohnilembus persalinus TaxID=266149 RepID=A0A0V0RAH9_PSEPJ|nr:GSKIP domain [Pseudocohnilembus persalinus]|eukprot:KRX11208.1 GSKIP domain [Pseudocohnilembus persalinus]